MRVLGMLCVCVVCVSVYFSAPAGGYISTSYPDGYRHQLAAISGATSTLYIYIFLCDCIII